MSPTPLSLEQLNGLERAAFVERLNFVFEGPPWIVERCWARRPFASVGQLHQALCEVMRGAGEDEQVALIKAHPDLVGRAALAGTLTPESTGEQAAAGLDALSPAEIAAFADYNRRYHDRFDFPFVICARENKKASILAGFERRLANDRAQEIANALDEVAKIARLRLFDRITPAQEVSMKTEISYGKGQVSMYRTYARPLAGLTTIPESAFSGREQTLFAVEVDVEVFGDNFMPAYTEGDNRDVVATDTMKNFVHKQALAFGGSTLEGFLEFLGRQFLATYPQMQSLRLTGREQPFEAAAVPEGSGWGRSGVLFGRSHNDRATASLDFARHGGDVLISGHQCGRVGLELIKVTGSAFSNFMRDGYTTLPERIDRPLFIFLDVGWRYGDVRDLLSEDHRNYVAAEQVRDLIQVVFHEFVSNSIQHLIHEMGQRLLTRFGQLGEVWFSAQNRLWDTAEVSAEDERIKVYTDPRPPYGMITLRLGRGEGGGQP